MVASIQSRRKCRDHSATSRRITQPPEWGWSLSVFMECNGIKMYRNDIAVHPDSRFTYDDSRLSYYTTTPLYSYTRNNKLKTVNYSRLTQLRNSETSLLQTLHDISQLSVKVIDGIGVALVPVGKLVFVFHFDLVLQTW